MSFMSKSPWVIHYDASSCNGCDIEVLATLCPGFDAERFGVINTGNPKHADIFLVTGSVNSRNIHVIREIYNQMPEPKAVIACGCCACEGGVFHDCYNVIGGVDRAIPVDVYAPGCAVRPEALIDAIVEAEKVLEEKYEAMKKGEHAPVIPLDAPVRRRGRKDHDREANLPTSSCAAAPTWPPEKKGRGYRCVNTHCVNTVDGVDIIYTFVVDGADDVYENYRIKNVPHHGHIPSIQGYFPGVFPSKTRRRTYGITVDDMLLDFHFNFYSTDVSEPMTVITPEKKAAMEKAAKIAKAKAAKAAKDAKAKADAAKAAAPSATEEKGE